MSSSILLKAFDNDEILMTRGKHHRFGSHTCRAVSKPGAHYQIMCFPPTMIPVWRHPHTAQRKYTTAPST